MVSVGFTKNRGPSEVTRQPSVRGTSSAANIKGVAQPALLGYGLHPDSYTQTRRVFKKKQKRDFLERRPRWSTFSSMCGEERYWRTLRWTSIAGRDQNNVETTRSKDTVTDRTKAPECVFVRDGPALRSIVIYWNKLNTTPCWMRISDL